MVKGRESSSCTTSVTWFVASLAAHGAVVQTRFYKRDNKPQHNEVQERQQTRHYETTNQGTMRCKRDNKPGFIRETTNHSTMSYKRGNTPGFIRETTNQAL